MAMELGSTRNERDPRLTRQQPGERDDAGIRLGEPLAKDMIAVRIGPDLRPAFVMEDTARPRIEAGRLVEVPGDRCPSFSGYPPLLSEPRQASPAFNLSVEALRFEAEARRPHPTTNRPSPRG